MRRHSNDSLLPIIGPAYQILEPKYRTSKQWTNPTAKTNNRTKLKCACKQGDDQEAERIVYRPVGA